MLADHCQVVSLSGVPHIERSVRQSGGIVNQFQELRLFHGKITRFRSRLHNSRIEVTFNIFTLLLAPPRFCQQGGSDVNRESSWLFRELESGGVGYKLLRNRS